MTETIIKWGKYVTAAVAAFIAIGSLIWVFIEPHAEDFVLDKVKAQNFASQSSVDKTSRTQQNLSAAVQSLQRQLIVFGRQQAIVKTDLDYLKMLGDEQRDVNREQREVNREVLRGINRISDR